MVNQLFVDQEGLVNDYRVCYSGERPSTPAHGTDPGNVLFMGNVTEGFESRRNVDEET